MKKPEWFELTESDHQEPYVNDMIPTGVMLFMAIGIIALFFLFPSKTGEQVPTPTPTIDAIVTPLDPITMPTISPDEEEGEDEYEDDSED